MQALFCCRTHMQKSVHPYLTATASVTDLVTIRKLCQPNSRYLGGRAATTSLNLSRSDNPTNQTAERVCL